MPIVQLTDIVARTAKAHPGKQVTYWDRTLPGFGLRVGEQIKAWTVMIGEERRRLTIGRYPTMNLHVARTEARRLILAATVARLDSDVTVVPFSNALEQFIDVHLSEKKNSTSRDWERVLRKHFAPAWKNLLMHEITRSHVAGVIDGLVRTSGEANNAFAVVRVFLRWSIRRGYLANNPMQSLALPFRRKARDRVLARDELLAILHTLDLSSSFGIMALLLLLTSQRRGEIAGLRSEWIDRDKRLMVLPKEITKNRQEHAVPLTPYVMSLLPDREGLLFPARGKPDRVFSGWSKCMASLRRDCGVDFRLHDLRRTGATMMAGMGTAPYVVERLLNHITGSTAESLTPLARIYNRHRYLDEMRSALLLLEGEVLRLLRECGALPVLGAGFEPGLDLRFDPADAARTELDPFGEEALLLQSVDVCGRVEDKGP